MKPVIALVLLLAEACPAFAEPENMALGRPYTLSARPNYGLCTDAGDAVQLTDGEWMRPGSNGFWTKKSAVGWTLGSIGDRIAGEIPPRQIVPEPVGEPHLVGMARIAVHAVDAVGGDLIRMIVEDHRYGAEAFADGHGFAVRKHPLDLVGQSGRRKIPVMRLKPQQTVAHTASYGIAAAAAALQSIDD